MTRPLLLLTPLLLLLAGASSAVNVAVKDLKFTPAALTVEVGSVVTWTNTDTRDYTVTAKNNTFNSGILAPGKKFSHTFTAAGTYEYGSKLHPRMKGVVVVK